MRKILLFLIVFNYSFAIISIEPKDIGENEPGVSAEGGISLEINRGNTDTTSTSISARVQKDDIDSLIYAIVNYEYGESKGEKNKDRAFLHIRKLIEIDNDNVWEIFGQIQRDDFKDQRFRALLGVGERYRFYNDNGKAYIGIGAFYEKEEIRDEGSDNYFRGNIYVSFKKRFNENVKMAFISYYQPRVDKFSDYESISSLEFSVKLTDKLSLLILSKYSYDSKPPKDIKEYDFTQKMGISYEF